MSSVLNEYRERFCVDVNGLDALNVQAHLHDTVYRVVQILHATLKAKPPLSALAICVHGSAVYRQWPEDSDVNVSLLSQQSFNSLDFRKFKQEAEVLKCVQDALANCGFHSVFEPFNAKQWLLRTQLAVADNNIPVSISFSDFISILHALDLRAALGGSTNKSMLVRESFCGLVEGLKQKEFLGQGARQRDPTRAWAPSSYVLSQILLQAYNVQREARNMLSLFRNKERYQSISTFFKTDNGNGSEIQEHVLHETGIWELCFENSQPPALAILEWLDSYVVGKKLVDPLTCRDFLGALNTCSVSDDHKKQWLEAARAVVLELVREANDKVKRQPRNFTKRICNKTLPKSATSGISPDTIFLPLKPGCLMFPKVSFSVRCDGMDSSGESKDEDSLRSDSQMGVPNPRGATDEFESLYSESEEADPEGDKERAKELAAVMESLGIRPNSPQLPSLPDDTNPLWGHANMMNSDWVQHSLGLRVLVQWGSEVHPAIVDEIFLESALVSVSWCEEATSSVVSMQDVLVNGGSTLGHQ